MKQIKAFSTWYAHRITPLATAIRPLLRRSLLILSLLNDIAALIMIVHGVFPFNEVIEHIIFLALAILLPISLLAIVLYIATLQMDLHAPAIRHWVKIIPPAILVSSFVVFYIIEWTYGKGSLQWERYFEADFFSIICIFMSSALSSFYAHLLSHAKSGRYDS
ncbi:MAG: hypothetical protein IJW98_03060 [Clostridia bacterium]|nr:hypothetical protein [Clostridia bacterium]